MSGINTGDGWLKIENQYLPTTVQGAPVVTPQEPVKNRMRIVYRSTEVRAPDGAWIPCTITGHGSRPDTYKIHVNPEAFASYSVPDVPATMLKRIVRLREPMPVTPQMAAVQKLRKVPTGFIYLKVNAPQGHMLEMKLLKRSPMRALMHVACDHLKLSRWTCESKTQFLNNGRQIYPGDFPDVLGLKDGDIIEMQRGAKPDVPSPVE